MAIQWASVAFNGEIYNHQALRQGSKVQPAAGGAVNNTETLAAIKLGPGIRLATLRRYVCARSEMWERRLHLSEIVLEKNPLLGLVGSGGPAGVGLCFGAAALGVSGRQRRR